MAVRHAAVPVIQAIKEPGESLSYTPVISRPLHWGGVALGAGGLSLNILNLFIAMNFASMDMLDFGKVIMLGLWKFKQAEFPIKVLDFWLKLTIIS